MEYQSVTQTVISAAGHRRHALAFNYASQALNNSFFLECLVRLNSLFFSRPDLSRLPLETETAAAASRQE
jgi:hypothetical protein